MDALVQVVVQNFQAYDWNSPLTIVFVLLAILGIMRKWGMFATLAVTIMLGIGGANLIVMNAATAEAVISVPMIAYAIGGIAVAAATVLAYIKFTLS